MAGGEVLRMAQADRTSQPGQISRPAKSGLAVRLQLRRSQLDQAAQADHPTTTHQAHAPVCLKPSPSTSDGLPEVLGAAQTLNKPEFRTHFSPARDPIPNKSPLAGNFNKLLERALHRAISAFSQKGFAATSTDELMRAMEVGRQSMYDTFGDKRALFLKALEVYVSENVRAINVELRAPGSPLAAIRSALVHFQNAKIFPVQMVAWD
jgi:hypothetical protein